MPFASSSSWRRNQPLGVMLPMGSFTNALGTSGGRFGTQRAWLLPPAARRRGKPKAAATTRRLNLSTKGEGAAEVGQASRLPQRVCVPTLAKTASPSRAVGRRWPGETPGLLLGPTLLSGFRLKTDGAFMPGFVFILRAIGLASIGAISAPAQHSRGRHQCIV